MFQPLHNVIFDLDGTLSDDAHRNHFISGDDKDWDSYYGACGTDEPLPCVALAHRLFASGFDVHILTGRNETVYDETVAWLERHAVCYHTLRMRSENCREADYILKPRWAQELGLYPTNTLCVFEDRDRVVRAWRAEGFYCMQVAAGDF